MLDALRRGANSWVLKPLLLLLVLAFVVWGVADVFTGARQTSLASVGGTEISIEQYQAAYNNVISNVQRQTGRRPTAEEARLRGVDRAVLDELVSSTALDRQIRDLRLALPQSAVIAAIEGDPNFSGADGRFDRQAFDAILRDIGYSERGYLNQRAREELRAQVTQSLLASLPVPLAMADVLNAWREETRTLQYFTFDAGKNVNIGAPEEASLKEVYTSNQRDFVTPEYRTFVVVTAALDDIKKSIEIPDEGLHKVFEADKAGRELPEKRRVQQIPFKDKAAAEAAARAIAGGKSFVEIAKEAGATEKDIDLGLVRREELIDPAIAKAAFALEKDKVSEPVQGRFSTVLLRVTEIEAARSRTFDEMKDQIRESLAATRTNEAIRHILERIEDGRAAGRPLKEIAEAQKLKVYEVAETDRQGRKIDGTLAYQGPDATAVLRSAFEGRPGVELDPVELTGGGYAWVDVISVTEQKQRPFEEVQDDVKKAWQRIEMSRQAADLATRLVERADKGETLTALAKEVGATLETSKPLKRFTSDSGLPGAAVQRSFAMALGARAAVDAGEDGRRRTVFRVVEINRPEALKPDSATQISEQIRSELQQDSFQAYILALRERYGVRVNDEAFRRATGQSTEQR